MFLIFLSYYVNSVCFVQNIFIILRPQNAEKRSFATKSQIQFMAVVLNS